MTSGLHRSDCLRERGRNSPRPRLTASLLSALLLCCFGCSRDVLNSLGELAQLRNDLLKEFHEQNININLNNTTHLAVTFLNSPLNQAEPGDRARRAQETALIIKHRYARIDQLESMTVKFMKNEMRWLVVNYTEQIDGYVFSRDAKLIGAPEYDPETAFKGEGDVTVNYNPTRNESEVRIPRLQLEGDTSKGVTMSPRFKVRGDAGTAGRAIGIPSAIIFDFASFAPDKIFKVDPALKIVADGIPIFNDKAHNLSTTTTGGNEFLVQAIPLDQFLKIAEAKTVVLTLESKEYLLNGSQLRALRDMATYANAGRKR